MAALADATMAAVADAALADATLVDAALVVVATATATAVATTCDPAGISARRLVGPGLACGGSSPHHLMNSQRIARDTKRGTH